MRKIIFILFFVMCVFKVYTQAQTPQYYNSNTGSSLNNFPFNVSTGKATCNLFLAGEFSNPTPLPSGMMITSVYFRTGGTAGTDFTNLHICFAQDIITTLTTGIFYPGPWDTVFVKDTTLSSSSGGWMKVKLRHPYVYDNTKSLIMFIGQCGYTGIGATIYNSTFSNIRRVWSVGGCPYSPYASGDFYMVNFGVDVVPALATPTPPILTFPPNNAIGVPITLTFKWHKTDTSTQKFWWQLVTDTTGLANLQSDSTITDTTKAVTGLVNLTNYFWRVKGKNNAGWGNFSGWFKFFTQSTMYYNYADGNWANAFPLNMPSGKMVQWLVLAGEFNQPSPAPAGYITNLNCRIATGNPLPPTKYYDIRIILGQTTITSMTSGTFYSGIMDTVYHRDTITISAAADTWLSFTLDHPFLYNPDQSLVIQIEQCIAAYTNNFSLAHTYTTTNRRVWSVGGCPYTPYSSVGLNILNCGINVTPVTAVTPSGLQIPKQYSLSQNYPNPFNPLTKINFDIPKAGFVTLRVYNILGKEAATLVNSVKNAGSYSVDFSGFNLSSGIYFYTLIVQNANSSSQIFKETKKLVLIK